METASANEILARPSGVPYGERSAVDVPEVHHEQVLPSPASLDDQLAWHLPGLIYLMTGLDRSVFELFALHLGRSVSIKTYQATEPIVDLLNAGQSRWAGVVQGLPQELNGLFVEHLESYVFRGRSTQWTLTARTVQVADPFRSIVRPTPMTLWLPSSTLVRARLIRAGGLQMRRPEIQIVNQSPEAGYARI